MFTLTITFNTAQELEAYLNGKNETAEKPKRRPKKEEEKQEEDLADESDTDELELEDEITLESLKDLVKAKVKAGHRDRIVALLKAAKVNQVSDIKGQAKIEAFYKKVSGL